MDAAENYEGTPITRDLANFISAQGILGMNANANNIARLNTIWIHMLECFVDEDGISEEGWRGRGDHIHPTRRNDRSAERRVARIDEVNLHTMFAWNWPAIHRISPLTLSRFSFARAGIWPHLTPLSRGQCLAHGSGTTSRNHDMISHDKE